MLFKHFRHHFLPNPELSSQKCLKAASENTSLTGQMNEEEKTKLTTTNTHNFSVYVLVLRRMNLIDLIRYSICRNLGHLQE